MSNYATPLNGIDWTDSRAERMFLEQQARQADHANSTPTPTLNKGPSNVTMSKQSLLHHQRINEIVSTTNRQLAEQVVSVLEIASRLSWTQVVCDAKPERLTEFSSDILKVLHRRATELLNELDGIKPDIDPLETTDN